jgi:quinol monooxygenase YgiN
MRSIGYLFISCLAFAAGSVSASCDEVGLIATFEVTEGQEEAFEAAIVKVAAKVMEVEEGTVFYSPYRGANGKYYMMERYQNLAAREAHAKDPAVLELFGPVMATLSAEVAVEQVALVCAEQAGE